VQVYFLPGRPVLAGPANWLRFLGDAVLDPVQGLVPAPDKQARVV